MSDQAKPMERATDLHEQHAEPPALPGRWTVCAMLFMATTINYMDRQVLSILKPALEKSTLHLEPFFHGWPTVERSISLNEIQYGNIVWCFQIAYALGVIFAERTVAGYGYLQLRRQRRGDSGAGDRSLGGSALRLACGFSCYRRIQRYVDRVVVGKVSHASGNEGLEPRCGRSTAIWSPVAVVAPVGLPANLGICAGQIPDRSSVVVLPVLAAELLQLAF